MAKKKPKLTPGQKAKIERCVQDLKAKGYSKSAAFAICTASQTRKKKR